MPITTIEQSFIAVVKMRDAELEGCALGTVAEREVAVASFNLALRDFAEGIKTLREKQESSTLSISDFPSKTFLSGITKGREQ